MKVFILMEEWNYEGQTFIAVFWTKELAEKHIEWLKKNSSRRPDDYEIIETEINDQMAIQE